MKTIQSVLEDLIEKVNVGANKLDGMSISNIRTLNQAILELRVVIVPEKKNYIEPGNISDPQEEIHYQGICSGFNQCRTEVLTKFSNGGRGVKK